MAMAGVLLFGPNGAANRVTALEIKTEALGTALIAERDRNRQLTIKLEEIEARINTGSAIQPSAKSSANR